MRKKAEKGRVLSIFLTFLKFGCFTFGGGWSIVSQIQKEYVEDKHWITDEELLDFTSVGRSVPGLMISNASVLFGYHAAGFGGALAALAGICLPPIVIMYGVTFVYNLVYDNLYIARAMMGVRAAVVPIILVAALKLREGAFPTKACYAIAIVACILNAFLNVNCVLVILLAVAAGLIMGKWEEAEA
mgnify:CR=1 FL=1